MTYDSNWVELTKWIIFTGYDPWIIQCGIRQIVWLSGFQSIALVRKFRVWSSRSEPVVHFHRFSEVVRVNIHDPKWTAQTASHMIACTCNRPIEPAVFTAVIDFKFQLKSISLTGRVLRASLCERDSLQLVSYKWHWNRTIGLYRMLMKIYQIESFRRSCQSTSLQKASWDWKSSVLWIIQKNRLVTCANVRM